MITARKTKKRKCFSKSKSVLFQKMNFESKIEVSGDVPLLNLAPDIRKFKLDKFLDLKSISQLMQTSKASHKLFREPLDQALFEKLLQHVVYGEEKEALAIIKTRPEFLSKHGTVKDYSDRTIKDVSPIECAYGAEDDVMLKNMIKFLDKNGRREALVQINKRFPEEKSEFKLYDFSKVVAAIKSNNAESIGTSLNKFRNDFKSRINKSGKHFNVQHLVTAYDVFYANIGILNWRATNIFWVKVVGYLQSLLPANYAQGFCNRLLELSLGNKLLIRSLSLPENTTFFDPRLGVSWAIRDGGQQYIASPAYVLNRTHSLSRYRGLGLDELRKSKIANLEVIKRELQDGLEDSAVTHCKISWRKLTNS